MPEAKLAREAEMCYATVAMVTDYDCWHPHHEDASVEAIVKVLTGNAGKARELVSTVVPGLGERRQSCPRGCHTALENAIITAPEARDPDLVRKLSAVAGRVLGKAS
jgi:5'-methylthioadenosine phosphorylase